MKLNKIIILILLIQIFCFTLTLKLTNVSSKSVKELNVFMKKLQYAATRYLDFLKVQKENYKYYLNTRKDINRQHYTQDYNLIKNLSI